MNTGVIAIWLSGACRFVGLLGVRGRVVALFGGDGRRVGFVGGGVGGFGGRGVAIGVFGGDESGDVLVLVYRVRADVWCAGRCAERGYKCGRRPGLEWGAEQPWWCWRRGGRDRAAPDQTTTLIRAGLGFGSRRHPVWVMTTEPAVRRFVRGDAGRHLSPSPLGSL
jgi:hypothetical protein